MQLTQIRHQGIRTESASATFYLNSSITSIEDVGKPVSIDPTADYTVGFVADADVLGVLESYEDRTTEGVKTGAVNWHNCYEFEYSGTAPTRGGRVVSDGAGKVKAAGAGAGTNTRVVSVDTTNQVVSVIFV